jgi:glycolate oxidase iron-sulfur subunit
MDKEKLSADLLKCARCGMCLAVCPVYRETLIETDSPRARIALIRNQEEKALTEKAGTTAKIYDCTTCMACSHTCPSGVHPDELILDARSHIRQKPLRLQKYIINNIMPYPSRLRRLFFPLSLYEKTGLRRLAKRTRLLGLLPKGITRFDAMLPELSGAPLYNGQKLVFRPVNNVKHRVGYFPGCAQNLVFTSVSKATIEVLLKNDCEVIIPAGMVCCGMPQTGYGEQETAKALARQNIEAFETTVAEYIITDCATCGSTLKSYGSLLKDDTAYAEKAGFFSQKVRDISEFLVGDIVLNRNFAKLNIRATYHEPCHLGRGQDLKDAPRKLLREILGDAFIEMNEADSCCGGAGSYTITHRDLSMKILDRKMKNVKDTRAEVLVTSCPGCEIQLAQGIKRSAQKLRLVHIVELLAEAYNQDIHELKNQKAKLKAV